MSESAAPNSVLSREELGALLESMAENARHEQARQVRRPLGVSQATGSRSELLRIARAFADEQGRSLSTLYQTSLTFELAQWEEIALRDFAAAMLDDDRVARIHIGSGHSDAFVLINRSFFFSWMMLAFGSKPSAGTPIVPDRPYTRIEERFFRRASDEIASTLASSVTHLDPEVVRVTALESPAVLLDRAARPHLVASFDVHGLGSLGRIRFALPSSIVESGAGEPVRERPATAQSELHADLLEIAVNLRVEVGSAQLSLSEVAALEPGSVIPLDASQGGDLLVRVGDKPKFRAERGTLNQKLAVRVLEEL